MSEEVTSNFDPMAMINELAKSVQNLQKGQIRGTSYWPYYKEVHAQEAQRILELVAKTGKPIEIVAEDVTLNTLKNKWYQSARYLVDHLDPEKRYHDIISRIDVKEKRPNTLVIRPKNDRNCLAAYVTEPWKPDFQNFIETAEHKEKFERYGIPLSDEDISWINQLLAPLANRFVYSVSNRGLTVVRYDQ